MKTNDFQLGVTLDSGQVFGFEKMADGSYTGRLRGKEVRLWQTGSSSLHVESARGVSEEAIADYFDLARDLSGVYKVLEAEPPLLPTLKKLKGLRIIRQDPWEALACFILSSNNNVKRIQGIYKNLVSYFGGFPKPGQIRASHELILRQLGLGYRAPFLMATARFVAANPVCLDVIREASYEEAVRKLYFRNRSVSEKKVQAFGQKRWGTDAGYVQQYLFHAARTGLLV